MSDRLTPHAYVPEGTPGWRTCKVCGIGANGSIHRAPEPAPTLETVAHAAAQAILDCAWASSESYTCDEANRLAALIRLTHDDATAHEFLAWHAESDEEGDEHYQKCARNCRGDWHGAECFAVPHQACDECGAPTDDSGCVKYRRTFGGESTHPKGGGAR